MLLENIQVNYYMNGRKIFNQSGEIDIHTIEANKLFLEEMFSIFHRGSEVEVIAELVWGSSKFIKVSVYTVKPFYFSPNSNRSVY